MAGNCSIFRTWVSGDFLTATDLVSSFTTVGVTNMTPQCLGGYAVDLTQFRLFTDPYPAGVASLTTSTAGELERIRFMFRKMFGLSQWYTHTEDILFPNNVSLASGKTLTVPGGGTLNVIGTLTIDNAATVTGLNWRLFSTAGTGFTLGDGITPGVFTGTAATYSLPKTASRICILIWARTTVNGVLNARFQATIKNHSTLNVVQTGPINGGLGAGVNTLHTYATSAKVFGYANGLRPCTGAGAFGQMYTDPGAAPSGGPLFIGATEQGTGTPTSYTVPTGGVPVPNGMDTPVDLDLFIDSVGGVLQIVLQRVEVWVV